MRNKFRKIRSLSENSKIVIKNALGAFLVKGAALILAFFTMPAYIHFFKNEHALGLWFTILSVLSWILNFDLGIGNGLRNHLTRTLTRKDEKETKKYLSSAYISIGLICVFTTIIFIYFFDYINWNKVFNIDTSVISADALLASVKIVFTGIIIQLFLKLISSVLYAMQKSSINNLLTLCTSIITVLCVSLIPSRSNDENMIIMSIMHTLAVALPLLVVTLLIFCNKKMRNIAPSIKSFSWKHAKDVLSLGGLFFFVQLVYMVIMSTNDYLITFFTGSANVVDYQIYNRLFSLGSTAFSLALTPVWSVVTKALTEKKITWLNSLYKKLIMLACIGSLLEFAIIPVMQIVIDIWLGTEAIKVNYIYALIFASLGCLTIFNSVLSSIANGVGELKKQAIFFGIGALIKVPVAWLIINITDSWIGVVAANAISMVFYCLIQPFWLKKYFSNNEKLLNVDL